MWSSRAPSTQSRVHNNYCLSIDYEEEQSSELETLRCIYTEQELTELATNPTSFQIKIAVNEATESDELSGLLSIIRNIVDTLISKY